MDDQQPLPVAAAVGHLGNVGELVLHGAVDEERLVQREQGRRLVRLVRPAADARRPAAALGNVITVLVVDHSRSVGVLLRVVVHRDEGRRMLSHSVLVVLWMVVVSVKRMLQHLWKTRRWRRHSRVPVERMEVLLL